ncbi:hypothetical protein QWJ34_00445 [Saccharibacillus sp. CPCC 101409]|uniref:hypothetical protein n=1 Tax=Saccharibacillus sp. CPCC 101409 TaxID=3058041 RepID=UPI0026726BD8|nr:hypothetical protein [Saccharibacillus sp. CPCC 101409]MDO3408226.1 hypothetical protein [Saccharibacillus sp. CPCC 101409]
MTKDSRSRIRRIAEYAAAGLAAGAVLGFLLKAVQSLSGHRVYRLLLNADYVPVLNRFHLNEAAEFGIHLLISAGLCIVLGLLWRRKARAVLPSPVRMASVTAVIGLAVGLLLYPTTLLSAGGTPPIDSLPALAWWLAVHLVYGAAAGLLLAPAVREGAPESGG